MMDASITAKSNVPCNDEESHQRGTSLLVTNFTSTDDKGVAKANEDAGKAFSSDPSDAARDHNDHPSKVDIEHQIGPRTINFNQG